MAASKKSTSSLSKSARNFRKNPESRANKDRISKAVNKRPDQVRKRVESNRKVREYEKKHGVKPSTKGLQYDHAVGRFVKAKTNQGRAGEGGRKKKK